MVRSVIGESTTRARLCPYCANSIEEDATNCPYCKADLLLQSVPQWLRRDEPPSEPPIGSDNNKKSSIPAKFIWMAAMLVVALIAFFTGGYVQRSQLLLTSQLNFKQLQAKDRMMQSQEAELAQTRQQLNENSNQLAEMKTKLEESQKELSATKQRLGVTRKVDRPNPSRSPAGTRTASLPAPVAARRTAEPGVYETTRQTSVYQDPSPASRVVSQISRGTRINVVRSAGDWLEVRSKHGNPPGYVRSDDARLIGRAN